MHRAAENFETFALALDENTDICDVPQFCMFVRGIHAEFIATEDLLSLQSVRDTFAGDDNLRKCNSAITASNEKPVGIAADGACAMLCNA